MKTVRVYRNPDCAKCARYARWHECLDWLGRVEASTRTPPGHPPLRLGEVVVEDLRDGRVLDGADGLALLLWQVPAYWPLRLLLALPPLRRAAEREMRGACAGSCGLPQ